MDPLPKWRGRGGQFGEIFRPEQVSRTDHYYGFALSRSRFAPVCGALVASQLRLMPQLPLLCEEGNTPTPIHSHPLCHRGSLTCWTVGAHFLGLRATALALR